MVERSAPARDAAGAAPTGARALVALLRPRQWTKNALVFAALVFSKHLFDPASVASALAAFGGFCLLSSATYATNDVLDAPLDRVHPEKRRRPVAAGAVRPGAALALSVGLAAAGLAILAGVNAATVAAGAAYLALTLLYSTLGKNVVVLDILLIASGFVVRAVAGALAIDVAPSSWFLACTLFGALFLALCKRKAELAALPEGARAQRPVLAAYGHGSLAVMISASMAALLITYALYVLDIRARAGVGLHPMELTLPCVVYAVFRYWLCVENRGQGESPEQLLLSDPGIRAAGIAYAVIVLVSLYVAGS